MKPLYHLSKVKCFKGKLQKRAGLNVNYNHKVHVSALTLKQLTGEVNNIDHGYNILFHWKALGPGIHIDILKPIKPMQTLLLTK